MSTANLTDRDEILELLTKAARMGDVSAMRILLTELPHGGEERATVPSVIDELATKRKAAVRIG